MSGQELVSEITAAVRVADERFESVGGSSRHFVRECLLPALDEAGLEVVTREQLDAAQHLLAACEGLLEYLGPNWLGGETVRNAAHAAIAIARGTK